jgi:TPR repeat protein
MVFERAGEIYSMEEFQMMEIRIICRRTLTVFLFATVAGVAFSQPTPVDTLPAVQSATETALQQGRDFAKKQDYAKALELWRPLAEQGNPKAERYLGFLYEDGDGVAKDQAQAIAWFRKAADQGDADAETNLGFMYANGQGIARDDAQAVMWFRKAADQGYALAENNLGSALAHGRGIAKDEAQAVTWLRKAADQGYADAENNLGVAYANGLGIAKDDAQAVAWYRKAAEQGYADAQFNLGNMYDDGRGIAKDEAQAVAWFRKAANQGYADAQYNLGFMFREGRGVAKDDAQAVAWYRKAADQGDAASENSLGAMYANGAGVPQSYSQAVLWYAKAAQQGHELATRNLEANVERLVALRMRVSAPVRARPELNSPVVKSATAGEVAYRISQFDNWYEVYFRDHNTVGYVAIPQAAVVVADAPSPRPSPVRQTSYIEPSSNYPAAPPKRPGVVSCRTNCNNGQCYRTYDDGKQVHFQAEHRYNPMTNEWEWDAGSC